MQIRFNCVELCVAVDCTFLCNIIRLDIIFHLQINRIN